MSESTAAVTHVDAVVIGAGFGGLAATYRLRELGLEVLGIERASGVGGTWFWNRYPGARTDSDGSIYRWHFFDDHGEPHLYSERFPGQPEVLEYMTSVAEKLHLLPLYRFGTGVASAAFDEGTQRWLVTTEDGAQVSTQFIVSAVGIQSASIKPLLPGEEEFQGRWVHTARWPAEGVELSGKRVAVVGTGSSGIQLLPEVAEIASQVFVLQRTPNYSVPVVNGQLTDDDRAELVRTLPEIRSAVRVHPFAMPYAFSGRTAMSLDDEERKAVYEEAWNKGGFRFLIESFDDIAFDKAANDTASDFLRGKIDELVHDPEVAAKLKPTYPYTVKRPPAGTRFFEAFNEDHVELVDLREQPLTAFTTSGVRVGDRELEVDVVIFATGFDFVTGSLFAMDIYGRGGESLKEHWRSDVSNYLSVAVRGFPNFFMIGGPQYPGGNWPTMAEVSSEFFAGIIAETRSRGAETVEVLDDTEKAWSEHVAEMAQQSMWTQYGKEANSYIIGANIEGKLSTVLAYPGGANTIFEKFQEEGSSGYPGFEFD